ncbi:hypothetical protein [Burkholderia multivorans]|uniref:hypothetical protein n=1 Tax=Burkholderia multivorans TaxID=87883 RepID=UPI00215935FC|nr:hypothetical protein [Burkholderia multivorans]
MFISVRGFAWSPMANGPVAVKSLTSPLLRAEPKLPPSIAVCKPAEMPFVKPAVNAATAAASKALLSAILPVPTNWLAALEVNPAIAADKTTKFLSGTVPMSSTTFVSLTDISLLHACGEHGRTI